MHFFSSSQCKANALAVISFELLWAFTFWNQFSKSFDGMVSSSPAK